MVSYFGAKIDEIIGLKYFKSKKLKSGFLSAKTRSLTLQPLNKGHGSLLLLQAAREPNVIESHFAALTDDCHVGKLHKSVIARCDGDLAQIRSRLLDLYVFQQDSALSGGSHLKTNATQLRSKTIFQCSLGTSIRRYGKTNEWQNAISQRFSDFGFRSRGARKPLRGCKRLDLSAFVLRCYDGRKNSRFLPGEK